MIKILFLLVVSYIALTSCAGIADKVLKKEDNEKFLYLVAGFDDAAENTDVLFTVGYSKPENKVYVAQIPRDTYFAFGGAQNKINQLYAYKRSQGEDKLTAMKSTANAIASLFGTKFDGFIGITTEGFRKVVDGLGGVDLYLNSDMVLNLDEKAPLRLNKGINHIDGSTAESFIRYRKGYTMGDLGRIDAQKIFLNALFAKLSQGITLPSLIALIDVANDNIVTDLNLTEIASFVVANLRAKDGGTSSFVTVPGEPIQSKSGLSYYVLNRKSSAEISTRYMFAEGEFDRNKLCLNSSDAGFANIYEDDYIKPHEYSSDGVADMHILKN